MNALNTSRARVVDPVLTGIAQGYRHAQRVGHVLFPAVEVPNRGGKVIQFGRESFLNYNARRAPGAHAVKVQFGYDGVPFSLSQYTLDVPIPREFMDEASEVPGVDLGRRATNVAMDSLTLNLEIEQAKLATDPANYTAGNKRDLGAADQHKWSDPASDPLADVDAAKEKVRMGCGIEPNRMVIHNAGFKALKSHPKIVERFKYTSSDSITTKMLAGILDLDELAVGRATYVEKLDDEAQFMDAWNNSAVLAYVPPQDAAIENPSFGYTYTLTGHPFVEPPRFEGANRSWVYGVTYERMPVLTGPASGFLFQNIA